jgi:hypothetical protein
MKDVKEKDASDYELIFMSFHESAHTIVALHNFFQVYYVNVRDDVVKDGSSLWYTSYRIGDSELKKTILLLEIQVEYAGVLGERIVHKDLTGSQKLPMNLRVGVSYDIKLASNTIRNNNLAEPGKDTANFKKNIQKKTEKILLEYWDDVKLLAHTLYDKRKLQYLELKNLLVRKSKNKKFWKDRFSKIERIYVYDGNNHPDDNVIKKIILNK